MAIAHDIEYFHPEPMGDDSAVSPAVNLLYTYHLVVISFGVKFMSAQTQVTVYDSPEAANEAVVDVLHTRFDPNFQQEVMSTYWHTGHAEGYGGGDYQYSDWYMTEDDYGNALHTHMRLYQVMVK